MKAIVFLLAAIIILNKVDAQNIGIGTNTPSLSAKLDVSDSAKGILIPRIDSLHRINISSPATGLMVYETTSASFWYFNGTMWLKIGAGIVSSVIADKDMNTSINTEKNTNEDIIRFSLNGNERWLMKNSTLESVNTSASVYIGRSAGKGDNLSTNRFNIGIGNSVLYNQVIDTTGLYSNTAIGSKAMYYNTDGHCNTALGKETLYSNTTGSFNVANGKQALFSNTTGFDNTAVGDQSMFFNTTGAFNTAIGDWSFRLNTVGNFNTVTGIQAMYKNISGSQNTATGCLALDYNSSGNLNTAVGYFSGLGNTTGNNNTLIGSFADVTDTNLINAGAIGYNAKVAQSNSFVIGGTGANAVNVGIGTSSPTERLDVQGNIKATGTITPSDIRFKKDIEPLQNSLQKISMLNGVSYNWKINEFPNRGFDNTQQLGFIAQDIEKIFPQIVHTGSDGYKGVDYVKLIPVLVEAMKEQTAANFELRTRLEKLEKLLEK